MSEFIDPNGDLMVPLRCQSCGEQIGLRSPGPEPDPDTVVARCYACAATEEAENITGVAARSQGDTAAEAETQQQKEEE